MGKVSTKKLEASILKALRKIQDPDKNIDIVALSMVSDLQISHNGEVIASIQVDPQRGPTLEPLRQKAEQAIAGTKGVTKATVVLTAERPAERPAQPSPQEPSGAHRAPDPHGIGKNPRLELPIKHIIAVASGKGGVGKSTIACNLAISLAKTGARVGLLDADIYGPSQPRMMGLEGQKPEQKNDKIIPLEAHGVKVMSIGFMVDPNKALVWRGPMVQSALYQMLRDVAWGDKDANLDILIVDMPPGTGDAQLTMAQKVPMSGAIIVSTPQDIALLDARKGVEMFNQVQVPVLGMIENMSTHICSNCGHEEHIFGHGGAEKEAKSLNVPFLGALPLDAQIRFQSDAGVPIVSQNNEKSHINAFDSIAAQIIDALSAINTL